MLEIHIEWYHNQNNANLDSSFLRELYDNFGNCICTMYMLIEFFLTIQCSLILIFSERIYFLSMDTCFVSITVLLADVAFSVFAINSGKHEVIKVFLVIFHR